MQGHGVGEGAVVNLVDAGRGHRQRPLRNICGCRSGTGGEEGGGEEGEFCGIRAAKGIAVIGGRLADPHILGTEGGGPGKQRDVASGGRGALE